MNAEETIRELISFGCSKNREWALNFLFFTNGNGYKWKKGQLIERTRYAPKEADPVEWSVQKEVNHFIEIRGWMVGEKEIEKIADQERLKMEEIQSTLEKRCQPGFALSDKVKLTADRIYPICEYSKIMNIPEDIQEDWLQVALEAVDMLISMGNSKENPDNIMYAMKAKEKISKILLKRSTKTP